MGMAETATETPSKAHLANTRSTPTASLSNPVVRNDGQSSDFARSAPLVGLISILTVLLHGFHPYSQDGSIYVAGIKRQIDASLYPGDYAFLQGHLRLSLFSWLMSFLIQHLHIPLDQLLFVTYVFSAIAFLWGCRVLAKRIFVSEAARWSATIFTALCFTLPAAATSLLIMDPYLTARSISTPLSLFAVVACLDRSWGRCILLVLAAAAMHPLMGAYLAGFIVVLTLIGLERPSAALALLALVLLLCSVLEIVSRRSAPDSAYLEAALSRGYYFLSSWKWYEVIGLVAPLVIMAATAWKTGTRIAAGQLCATGAMVGTCACIVSVALVHADHPDLLMRLQVLRSFHLIYLLGAVLLGGYLALWPPTRQTRIRVPLFILIAAAMFVGDRQSYPRSDHIEWTGTTGRATDRNQWMQAFNWIRTNTPKSAIFAVDPNDLAAGGEDAIGFRAVAERSILTDVKDEGIASLVPSVAGEWKSRELAETGLDPETDAERLRRLQNYHVNWLLLSSQAQTGLACPYRNATLAVCTVAYH
jgi:hypothetical protein